MSITKLIESLLAQDPTLTTLIITPTILCSPLFPSFTTALGNNTQVQTLDLSTVGISYFRHSITAECLTILCAALEKMVNLQALNLHYRELASLDPERLRILCTSLGKMVNLQTLNLIPYYLRDGLMEGEGLSFLETKNLMIFCTALEKLVNLKTLNLSYNRLSSLKGYDRPGSLEPGRLMILCTALEKMVNLQSLNLSVNTLGSVDAGHLMILCKTLGRMTNLQTLDLSNNGLNYLDLGRLTILGKTLEQMTNLQTLNLSNNWLDGLDTQRLTIFGTAFQKMAKLQALKWGWQWGEFINIDKSSFSSLQAILKTLADPYQVPNNLYQQHKDKLDNPQKPTDAWDPSSVQAESSACAPSTATPSV